MTFAHTLLLSMLMVMTTGAFAQVPALEVRRVPEPLLGSPAPVSQPVSPTGAPTASPMASTRNPAAAAPAPAAVAPSVSSGTAVAAALSAPAAPAPGKALAPFVQARNERLSVALRAWLRTAGWDLRWDAAAGTPGRLRDFVVAEPVTLAAPTLVALLDDLLRHTGLRATVYAQDRIVVVRNDDLAAAPPESP